MITRYYNKLLIILLPYTVLFGFVLIKLYELSLYNTIGIISVFLFIVSALTSRNFQIKDYTIYILLFGTYVILSDILIAGNEFSFYEVITKNVYIFFFCFANIIENTHISERKLKQMVIPLFVTVVFSFVVIVIQQSSDPLFMVRPSSESFTDLNDSASEIRLFSIFTYTSLGDMALLFVPFSAILASYYLNNRKHNLGLVVIIVAILTTFLSKSRGTLTTALPLLLLLYLGRSTFSSKKVIATLFFVFFLSFPLIWLSEKLNFDAILQDRILETSNTNIEDKTAYTRIIAIQAFVEFYPDAPIFGAGNTKYGSGGTGSWDPKLENFLAGRSSQIHIGILALFYLYGAVGAFFFIMFCYKLLRRVYLVSKVSGFWGPFFGILALPILNLTMDWFNPFSTGILLCIVFNKYLENQLKGNRVDEVYK